MNEDITLKKRNDLAFFHEALEYFEKNSNFDSELDSYIHESHNPAKNANLLRDEMLTELNNLKELIINNPDLKLEALDEEEKQLFFRFVNYYSTCPLCGTANHYSHLKKLYFNEENEEYKQILIDLMSLEKKTLQKLTINIGVLCCTCFKKHFE